MSFATDTARKIESFRNLSVGWHYGDGGPASDNTIANAESILWVLHLEGMSDTNAFPGINGEVMVTAYLMGHYLEAIAETDGSISLTYEINDTEAFSKDHMMPPDEAIAKVREILGEIWSTSGFYTSSTSTIILSRTDSRVWLSETLPMGAEHPLSNEPVLMQRRSPFVSIYEATTPHVLRANHPFF